MIRRFLILIVDSTVFPLVEQVCTNITWSKRGVLVAGGDYPGSGLNQLRSPIALALDTTKDILYVGDNGNSRIVTWPLGSTRGSIIAGDNGQGNRTDQLGWVRDLFK